VKPVIHKNGKDRNGYPTHHAVVELIFDKRGQTGFKTGNKKEGIQIRSADDKGYKQQQDKEFLFNGPGFAFIILRKEVRKNQIQSCVCTEKYQYINGYQQGFMEFVVVDQSKGLKDISQYHLDENHPDKVNPSLAVR